MSEAGPALYAFSRSKLLRFRYSGTPQRRRFSWAERSYSTFKVRRRCCEEIPIVQGKEQWLRFAGAAMKRYPMSKVRETQVRQ